MTDKKRCEGTAADVSIRITQFYQCTRNATVKVGGKWYCWQHDPAYKKKKESERDAKWDREWEAKQEGWRRRDAEQEACRGVPTDILEEVRVVDLLEVPDAK